MCAWNDLFLATKKQHVIFDGEKSSGVSQGSVTGPLIFTVYINDLVHNIGSSMSLFADDGVVYREVATLEKGSEMQEDLQRIVVWCRE